MLRKERELEEARKKLAQIRQQQYKFLPSGFEASTRAAACGCIWASPETVPHYQSLLGCRAQPAQPQHPQVPARPLVVPPAF